MSPGKQIREDGQDRDKESLTFDNISRHVRVIVSMEQMFKHELKDHPKEGSAALKKNSWKRPKDGPPPFDRDH